MKITINDLENKGYRLINTLDHKEIVAFVTPYLKKFNVATILFVTSNLLFIVYLIFLIVLSITHNNIGYCILYLIAGFILAHILIPIHELIHALAYKLNGAKDVSFDTNFKKFIFLTVADKFVASRKEFVMIAMAPFTIITILLSLLFIYSGIYGQFLILGMLCMHTTFCMADFGLVSYFISQRGRKIITFDSKEHHISYFYEKS